MDKALRTAHAASLKPVSCNLYPGPRTLKLVLVTPYPPETLSGNAHTALRWRRFLRAAGHRVRLMLDWDGAPADAMIALHARRSAPSIARFAERHPDRALIVVLTGTDLYRDLRTSAEAQASLRCAHRLVVLQEEGLRELAAELWPKTRVIHQSAPALRLAGKPKRHFQVCVGAHLREEKDPFRAAYASGLLAPDSRIRIHHLGAALSPAMAAEAARCASLYPRWHWLGARPHGETRRRIAASHVLVVSSRMEGGANVICEAVAAGVPVIASDVPGNRGMLGLDYAGYYPVGDTAALARMLARAESDADFLDLLGHQCAARAPLFRPEREAAAVAALIEEVTRPATT